MNHPGYILTPSSMLLQIKTNNDLLNKRTITFYNTNFSSPISKAHLPQLKLSQILNEGIISNERL
jgi:hypothetical protein